MARDLFDIQQKNYVTRRRRTKRRRTKRREQLEQLLEADQQSAFLEGAKNVAWTVKDGPLKMLLQRRQPWAGRL